MFAEDEARILIAEARAPAELDAMVERRATGEPLELIVGWAEFRGLKIAVAPGVFVPRVRSELLAGEAIGLAADRLAAREVNERAQALIALDICCGSGAIGVALITELEPIELYAVEIDPAAAGCARRNLASTGATVLEGDLYEPLPGELHGRIDLLIANAPYVPSNEIGLMPREARLHEHLVALDGGPDGLEIQRRIAADAPDWLAPHGHLLIETSEPQAPVTAEIVSQAGLDPRVIRSDELDATVVAGSRAGR